MMINTIYNSKSQKGFTIVELVLTIAIIGLLSTVVGPIIMNAMRGYTLVSARRSTLAETRQAMERMISDIQRIPSSNAIDIFTPNALQFDISAQWV
jgi:prepilin-type N-terminal cleavage/methylation domain-containing protein